MEKGRNWNNETNRKGNERGHRQKRKRTRGGEGNDRIEMMDEKKKETCKGQKNEEKDKQRRERLKGEE